MARLNSVLLRLLLHVMAIVSGSRIVTGLPQFPEGVPPELFNHFFAIHSAIGNLQRALSQFAGVDAQPDADWPQVTTDDTIHDGNLNRWYVKANEALVFGQAVSPFVSAGELQVRLANATNNTRWCCGFVTSPGNFAIGEFVEVKTKGLITGIAGMTAAVRYWLSTVNGQITNVEPVAAGNIGQVVGFALASNRLLANTDFHFNQH